MSNKAPEKTNREVGGELARVNTRAVRNKLWNDCLGMLNSRGPWDPKTLQQGQWRTLTLDEVEGMLTKIVKINIYETKGLV